MIDSEKSRYLLLHELNILKEEIAKKEADIPFYKSIVENGDTIIVLIEDMKIVYANRAVERIIGYKKEELHMSEFLNFIHTDDREIALNKYKRLTSNLFTSKFEFRVNTKKGSIKWFIADSKIIRKNNKKLLKAILFDVSE